MRLRLTEDPNVVVLVIEAGGHHGAVPEIDVPGKSLLDYRKLQMPTPCRQHWQNYLGSKIRLEIRLSASEASEQPSCDSAAWQGSRWLLIGTNTLCMACTVFN